MIDWPKAPPLLIAAIGECLVEQRDDDPPAGHSGFSGDTLNFATYLARLLPEAQVFYLTALGDDALSERMLAAWRAENIRVELVRRRPGKRPGRYVIATDRNGERTFSYDREQSAAREVLTGDCLAALREALKDFHLFYLSGISLAILSPADREKMLALLRSLRTAGVIAVYDSNYRPALWASAEEARRWTCRVYGEVDAALTGFADEQALFGDGSPAAACRRLATLGPREIVVKNGSSPAALLAGGRVSRHPVGRPASAVDTTAAGDSFNAGYLAARLSGRSAPAAVAAGQALARRVVQFPGAIIPREEPAPAQPASLLAPG